MAFSVEANSLSDINRIASNLPKYPRNPTKTPRKSLTLYISRVPGTRDIILTTLKPLKNVTALDVNNSLYYLRLNSESSNESSGEILQDVLSESVSNVLKRKPLPEKPSSFGSKTNGKANHTHSIKRKPVGQSVSVPSSNAQQPPGPRLSSCSQNIVRKPLPGAESYPKCLPPTTTHPNSQCLQHQGSSQNSHTHPTKSPDIFNENFSVTIIRRDPSSGAQWNIGIVSGHPVREDSQSARQFLWPVKKQDHSISICLITPGYIPFRHQGPFINNVQNESSDFYIQTLQNSGYTFDRKLLMEGSSFWSRASGQRRRAYSDLSDKQSNTRGLETSESFQDNYDSKNYQGKGYVFISPWGGRCKFLTGNGGRSIRCQHTLPSPVSKSSSDHQKQSVTVSELRFNLPLSSLTHSAASQLTTKCPEILPEPILNHFRNRNHGHKESVHTLPRRPMSALYSYRPLSDEEKLNCPQSRLSLSLDRGDGSQFETTHMSRNSTELSNHRNADINMETSQSRHVIGREKATGVNSDKRAKLGKLIIHDEGLKMLDLVISANMAIWWSIWGS